MSSDLEEYSPTRQNDDLMAPVAEIIEEVEEDLRALSDLKDNRKNLFGSSIHS